MKSMVPMNWMGKTGLHERAILTMSKDIRSFAMVDTPTLYGTQLIKQAPMSPSILYRCAMMAIRP